MNTNKNSYTFIYASILVIIVAFLLAFVSSALHSRQQANIELDQKKQILASLNIIGSKDAAADYTQCLKAEYLLDENGAITDQSEGCAFACATIKSEIETKHPVYVCEVEGATKYVFPLNGNGLWGPIWGYIALNDDRQTVYGVYFSHASETPGLGAEITNHEKFQIPFIGKHVMRDGAVALSVVKNGNVRDDEFEVNGISGGTFTSKGVDAMIKADLIGYQAFLAGTATQVPAEAAPAEAEEMAEEMLEAAADVVLDSIAADTVSE